MLGGILLIAAGLGLFLTSRSYFDVADGFNKSQAQGMNDGGAPRMLKVAARLNARWGARTVMWVGRGVGAAAIVVGIILLAR